MIIMGFIKIHSKVAYEEKVFRKMDGREVCKYFYGTSAMGCPALAARLPPATLPLPLLNSTGEKIRCKSSWAEIKAGRSLTTYHHGKNRRHLRKICVILPVKSRVGPQETKANLKHFPPNKRTFFPGSALLCPSHLLDLLPAEGHRGLGPAASGPGQPLISPHSSRPCCPPTLAIKTLPCEPNTISQRCKNIVAKS